MKIIIDRSKWNTGRYFSSKHYMLYGPSRLLNAHGMRCCLGFLGKECGFDGLGKHLPERGQCSWPEKLFQTIPNNIDNMTILNALVNINDSSSSVSDQEREDWVSEGFKAMDCEVEFIGEYLDI